MLRNYRNVISLRAEQRPSIHYVDGIKVFVSHVSTRLQRDYSSPRSREVDALAPHRSKTVLIVTGTAPDGVSCSRGATFITVPGRYH